MMYAISLLAGALAVSIAEHFLKLNFVDAFLNLFRSTEQRLKLLEHRAAQAAKDFRAEVEQKVTSVEQVFKARPKKK